MSKVTQKNLLIAVVIVVLMILALLFSTEEEIIHENKGSWEGTYEGVCDKYDILDDSGEVFLISSNPITIPKVNYTIQINKSYAAVTMDSDIGVIYCDSLNYELSEDKFTLIIDFEPGNDCEASDMIISKGTKTFNIDEGKHGRPSFTIKKTK